MIGRQLSVLPVLSASLGAAILALDSLTPTDGNGAILYVSALLLPAARWDRRGILAIVIIAAVTSLASYAIAHGLSWHPDAVFRRIIGLTVIIAASLLVLRSVAAQTIMDIQSRLLDQADDAVFLRGADDVVTYWNHGAQRLYGWSAAEAIGQPATQLLQTVLPAPRAEIEQVLGQTGRWQGEVLHTARDGMQVAVACRWTRQPAGPSGPAGTLEMGTDITQHRRAQQRLRQSEARHRTIVRTSGVAIWEQDYSQVLRSIDTLRQAGVTEFERYFDKNPGFVRHCLSQLRLVSVNESGVRMFEAEREQDLLHSLERIYLPGSTGSFATILTALAQGAPSCAAETSVLTLRGRPLTVLMSISFPHLREKMDSVLVSIVDNTGRRVAEGELAQAKANLEHITQLSTMGKVTAAIAHEVNQPLGAIVANAEATLRWLQRGLPDLVEARQAIQRIIRDGSRATEVAARLRSFRDGAAPKAQPFHLREAIDQSCQLLGRDMAQHGVSLHRDIMPDLPVLVGDRLQIEQVVVNLMMNAIQSMAACPIRADEKANRVLSITATRFGGTDVMVEVRDTGSGITDAVAVRLFQPFFTSKPDGMGLGLAICRSILDAHGGHIWASRPEAGGAAIHFTLPGQPPASG
jgi:PAS domain S-box-containing protein